MRLYLIPIRLGESHRSYTATIVEQGESSSLLPPKQRRRLAQRPNIAAKDVEPSVRVTLVRLLKILMVVGGILFVELLSRPPLVFGGRGQYSFERVGRCSGLAVVTLLSCGFRNGTLLLVFAP